MRVVRNKMKLPNGEGSIVEIEKLRDDCLNPGHPRERHKARVFQSHLGMTAAHAEELCAVLLGAAMKEEATLGASDRYGTRHITDFELSRGERTAGIRSCWIALTGETAPRFVTFYVLWDEGSMGNEVAVLRDMPEIGLVCDQVGTVVELLAPSVAEVEFSDDRGRANAIAALRSEELIRLHHRPYEQTG